MKICTVCGSTKTEGEFFYRDKRNEKLHSQCKSCYVVKRKKIWHEHYHKYGSQYRERAVERNKKLKQKLRKLLLDYLTDKSCVECGNGDYRVLEFDHIDPAIKSFGIAQGIHNIMAWPKILAEIEKCQILCANCHKLKTAGEQGWYKNI